MKLGRISRCMPCIFGLLLSLTSLGAFAQTAPKVYHLGILSPELDAKRLLLLHEAVPNSRRIAALAVHAARDTPNVVAVKEAADRAGIELLPFYAASRDEYTSVFAAMRSAGAEALEIISAPELYTDAALLAELAAETRLPTICEWADMAQS